MKITYTLLLLLFCTAIANAQKITVFNSSNSNLPNYRDDDVNSLVVDTKGNVWMQIRGYGTYEYDGHQFTHIDTLDKFTSPLFADREGDVWFHTRSTLIKFDGKNWIKYTPQQTGIKNAVFTMAEASSGKLYIGTGDGLFTFDGNHWEQISLPRSDMYSYEIRSIEFSSAGDTLAGSSQGLLVFNGKDWTVLNEHNSKIAGFILVVKYSPTGELYIGYIGGPRGGGFSVLKNTHWENYDSHNSKLQENYVRNIEFTADSAIWMATNNGILKIKDNKWSVIKFTKSDNEPITDLAAYHNILWIITLKGLVKYEE